MRYFYLQGIRLSMQNSIVGYDWGPGLKVLCTQLRYMERLVDASSFKREGLHTMCAVGNW